MATEKKKLVIVESPAKMKSLRKFLGSGYIFESSIGHIIDLPANKFGIDMKTFDPEYTVIPGKEKVVAALKKQAAKCDTVYLCPDPDREGEAIAWHIQSILPKKLKKLRSVFYSITKEAVQEAIDQPRELDMDLVNAQQARRMLDRIVGYKISPILARRVTRGTASGTLSAGRVQSVALKLVVDREKAIEAFVPVEYWNLSSLVNKGKSTFAAQLYSVDGKKVEKEPVFGKKVFLIPDEKLAHKIKARLQKANYTVKKVVKKEKKRNPTAPFITSTLQQEASRHFGFAPSRTMGIAQSLYEGVELGSKGTEGLITYMRTDSVRISKEGISQSRTYIEKKFGKEFLPKTPNVYSSKKATQDAHEAIRPTKLTNPPEEINKYLDPDQRKLYGLIWNRAVASQMAPAVYDTVSCEIDTDQKCELRASGSVIKFQGFLKLYEEKVDEGLSDQDRLLPELVDGDKLTLKEAKAEQAFTKPPPRFSEASLVKELEKSGVGRPSTFAPILKKIESRAYTTRENKRLVPTELGKVIAEFLEVNFPMIMNIDFTSEMEDSLEQVALGKKEMSKLLKEFWKAFEPVIKEAEKNAFVPKKVIDRKCPKCGKNLQKIWARSKYFYGCSGYPDCDFTEALEAQSFSKEDYDPNFDWEQPCPKCESKMTIRHGKFGAFLGCSRYPDCKGLVNIPKVGETSETYPCPAVGCDGTIIKRMSRFGKPFYSCDNYPDCDVIVNDPADLETKYKDHPKTAYKKPAKGSGGRGSKTLSPVLAKITKSKSLTRGQITKKIWEYIKEKDLQDPKNKRTIIADDLLKEFFDGRESIDMFELARFISKHIS